MLTLICSPRHIEYWGTTPVIGLPTVFDGLDVQGGAGLVSDTNHAPNLNLCVWEADLTQEQIDAISAHPDGYVFDMAKLAAGDVTEFVAWLIGRQVTRGQFAGEFAKMRFAQGFGQFPTLAPLVINQLPTSY